MEITTLGIDLAKSVFQLHGVDADGAVVLQKKLRRGAVLDFLGKLDPCLIGMEACATSHYWAREIAALGHDVRLIPPAYVKPYVKRQKNDAGRCRGDLRGGDAAQHALCAGEDRGAAECPGPAPVARPADAPAHDDAQCDPGASGRVRDHRGTRAKEGCRTCRPEPSDVAKPSRSRRSRGSALLALAAQLDSLATAIRDIERQLLAWHRQNAASQRLETIPGVGIITATALAASVPDPSVFKSGRQFAAFLGLVPRQNSSGGKDRLGHISKMGNGYLRRLLVVGATSVTRRAETTDTRTGAWVRSLLGRKPTRLVTVAIANKTARTAWAMLVRQEDYRASAMA